jgi:hypothetical protein
MTGFVNGFIPWWYRIRSPAGNSTLNAGHTLWSVLAVAAAATCVLLVLARAAVWPEPAPARDGLAYTLLGLIPIGILVTHAATGEGIWAGVWAQLVVCTSLALGGLRRRGERRVGWS